MAPPHRNWVFLRVASSAVRAAFVKSPGLLAAELESTGVFPLLSSDWSQGHTTPLLVHQHF